MARKYGIQLRGLGRALKPKGPGVLRPKPTDRYGQQMKPKPIRPGKKDGGRAKKFPDLTGDGKVTRADILKGRGVFAAGGQARRKEKLLDKLGATDKEKEFYLIKGGDVSKDLKKLKRLGIKKLTPEIQEKLTDKNFKRKKK